MISNLLMFVGGVIVAIAIVSALSFVFMAFKGGLDVYNENVALRIKKLEKENIKLLDTILRKEEEQQHINGLLNNKINFVKADVELMKEDE